MFHPSKDENSKSLRKETTEVTSVVNQRSTTSLHGSGVLTQKSGGFSSLFRSWKRKAKEELLATSILDDQERVNI